MKELVSFFYALKVKEYMFKGLKYNKSFYVAILISHGFK